MISICILLCAAAMCGDNVTDERSKVSTHSIEFEVTPAAGDLQLVRTSIPFPNSFLKSDSAAIVIGTPTGAILAGVRPLTFHSRMPFVRRGLVTFTYRFTSSDPVRFTIRMGEEDVDEPIASITEAKIPSVTMEGGELIVDRVAEFKFKATPVVPRDLSHQQWIKETVEKHPFYEWYRFRGDDEHWPLIIDVRADTLGGVVAVAHLQKNIPGDDRAPAFGWEIQYSSGSAELFVDDVPLSTDSDTIKHSLKGSESCRLRLADGRFEVYHPTQPLKKKGSVELQNQAQGIRYRYLRSTKEDQVPMQQATWQRAEFVFAPTELAKLTASLCSPHHVKLNGKLWDELYGTGNPLHLGDSPELLQLINYHHDAIVYSMARGDDWGNVTSFADGSTEGGAFGMNRLNHCPPIFEEGYRSGDHRLIETALLWCDNFYDQSIWWGEPEKGGTRYNNIAAAGRSPLDNLYMWRSNDSVHFCTKGYDSFLLAYEETGDPRMMEALHAQIAYAKASIHSGNGECRNIGDVRDFIRLFRYTADREYKQQGLRLFRELVPKLSPDALFSQSGHPLETDGPFIEDDEFGYKHPFAKPYIIGYALAGLPALAREYPDEPRLRETIRAVADFLATSQDPLGGWRYPHPKSSSVLLSQALEHAWQIVQADKLLGPDERHLDAIERVLRQRFHGWRQTGKTLGGVGGWELATGKIESPKELYSFYRKPSDRDSSRDYSEGSIGIGGSPPEGIVYFTEVLAFYLEHRPLERITAPPEPNSPLGIVLARLRGEKP